MDENSTNSLEQPDALDDAFSNGEQNASDSSAASDAEVASEHSLTSEVELTARQSTISEAELSSAVLPAAAGAAYSNGNGTTSTEAAGEKSISIIAREATVLGDIITEGHIDVIGNVRGNIAAQGDVAIHGQVRGNVDGEKIGLYNSRVKGNLSAKQGVIVNDTSIIDGDVATKNIIFDGKVRGSIAAESVVVLRSHSYCLGDVTAASIAVEPGAVINGTVRTIVEGDLEAPFEE